LADKFRASAGRIYRKYQKTMVLPHGTQKVLEVTVESGEKKVQW
jgi:hypothetical protein